VLYGEVETATELRQRVSEQEAEMSQLRQELNLQRSELALAQKAADVACASQSEIARLRSEASERQAALNEAAKLREVKRELEVKLEDTRAQMGDLKQMLQEWKQKLSTLIGD
jgi:chromosome segregation ATPase